MNLSHLAVVAVVALLPVYVGCGPADAEFGRNEEGPVAVVTEALTDYATAAGISANSAEANGVLAVANASELSASTLTTEVGLDSASATSIATGRPFASLAALNAVSGASTLMFVKLLTSARARGLVTSASQTAAQLDEVFSPADCRLAPATPETFSALRGLQAAAGFVPAVGGMVVHERTCSVRAAGPDCSPFRVSPCAGSIACTEERRLVNIQVQNGFLQLANGVGRGARVGFGDRGLVSSSFSLPEAALPGAGNSGVLNEGAPTQLTARCARVPFPIWTVRAAEATYREYRAAFVARFDTDATQAAPAGSPFAATSCDGARMTRVQGESRFPVGSGLNTIDVSAQVSATVGTRRCVPSATGAGASCTEWSEAACTESWCAALASARAVTFRQQDGGVALDLPRLSVAVPAQVVISTPAQGSIAAGTNAIVTNGCFRIPFFRPWSGDPATGWTEERGVVIARY